MPKILCSRSAMLTASLGLWFNLLAVLAGAQNVLLDQGHEYGVTPSPNNLAWELRTAANDVVRWEWNGVASLGPNGDSQELVAHADTASSLGLDWAAWTAAVLNPAFNRSLVTWNGITTEMPWPAEPDRRVDFHELDELRLGIGFWAWPQTQFSSKRVLIVGTALDIIPVPEPASWLLAIPCCFAHLRTRRKLDSTDGR